VRPQRSSSRELPVDGRKLPFDGRALRSTELALD
jgi:hypothetical protein